MSQLLVYSHGPDDWRSIATIDSVKKWEGHHQVSKYQLTTNRSLIYRVPHCLAFLLPCTIIQRSSLQPLTSVDPVFVLLLIVEWRFNFSRTSL